MFLVAFVVACQPLPVEPHRFPPEVPGWAVLRNPPGHASVTTDDYSGTEPPSGPVFFEPHSSSLTLESRDVLATFAAWAARRPCRIRVAGRTDDASPLAFNPALGERRARVVADYLVALGVSSARIDTIADE
jgi:peptidoglycan-associated lipoprotein